MSFPSHPAIRVQPSDILTIGIILGPQCADPLSILGLDGEGTARQLSRIVKDARNALRFLLPGPEVQFYSMFPAERAITVVVMFREGTDVTAEDIDAFCEYCREVVSYTAELVAKEAMHGAAQA
ncbi:hypothetical protein VQH23_12745 [Pararoseomonas sp. SCSIO 73927]|uniref:hypothetical protein n=1 Tax=Pararoseomonas sp. SCSIO 73927 TaxID=3114537 RepID=UPI0030CD49B2